MRFLLIDDFDNRGDKDVAQLTSRWVQHLGIPEADVTVCRGFKEGLQYVTKHPNSFDVALLDMYLYKNREPEPMLHEKYFHNTLVTDAYFNDHVKDRTGVLMLKYLYEVLRFPLQRIAFLSGFVASDSTGVHKKGFEELIKEFGEGKDLTFADVKFDYHQIFQKPDNFTSTSQSRKRTRHMNPREKREQEEREKKLRFQTEQGGEAANGVAGLSKEGQRFHKEFLKDLASDYMDLRRCALDFAILTTTHKTTLSKTALDSFYKIEQCLRSDASKNRDNLDFVTEAVLNSQANVGDSLENFMKSCQFTHYFEGVEYDSQLRKKPGINHPDLGAVTTLKLLRNGEQHADPFLTPFTLEEGCFLILLYFNTCYDYGQLSPELQKEYGRIVDNVLGERTPLPKEVQTIAAERLFQFNKECFEEGSGRFSPKDKEWVEEFCDFGGNLKVLNVLTVQHYLEQYFFSHTSQTPNFYNHRPTAEVKLEEVKVDLGLIDRLPQDSVEKRMVEFCFYRGILGK